VWAAEPVWMFWRRENSLVSAGIRTRSPVTVDGDYIVLAHW